MAVARFDVAPGQGKLPTGFTLSRHTPLFAYTRQGHACRFRTCYPVTLWPLAVTYAAVEDTGQFDVLRLKLRCDAGYLSELELRRLRFYLDGEAGLLGALYELLFCNVAGVVAL